MIVQIENDYTYHSELRKEAEALTMPLSTDDVTSAMTELVDELYTRSILAETLPYETTELDVTIAPAWSTEPTVDRVEVTLTGRNSVQRPIVSRAFDRGPWIRRAQHAVQKLRTDGSLGDSESAYRMLVALRSSGSEAKLTLPGLQPPPIVNQSLAGLGVQRLGDGTLDPDRPVLVNARLVDDAVEHCERAGPAETGGAVLGIIARLPESLPGTNTRLVTFLTAIVPDSRHVGNSTQFHISQEALIEAVDIAAIRARNETPITIFHTHGWGCGDCNQKACLLAECYPSLQDYDLEALFPTKALLLPIAGRKLGAPGRRPILQIHGWDGGELRPIRWQTYYE